jgi:hypothetical protein
LHAAIVDYRTARRRVSSDTSDPLQPAIADRRFPCRSTVVYLLLAAITDCRAAGCSTVPDVLCAAIVDRRTDRRPSIVLTAVVADRRAARGPAAINRFVPPQ